MSRVTGISKLQNTEYNIRSSKVSQAGSESFASYLEERTSLDDIFQRASIKYNVPLNLLKAIGKAEADFNPNAVSKAGAQGVMQLMPKTAEELGVTDSFDPEQNIMGGAKYISDLLKRYDGDTKLALAAYNAGMGNVKKYGGVPPFEETQNYVVKVMKYMEQDIAAGTVKTSGSKSFETTGVSAAGLPIGNIPNWHTPPAFPSGKLSADSITDMLDLLFSYNDYLRFLNIFLDGTENY